MFNPYLNIAELKVRGIDIEAQYLAHPEWISGQPQTFSIRAFGSKLLERTNIPTPGAPVSALRRRLRQHRHPVSEWKGNLAMAYTVGAWTAQLSEEWIGKEMINTTWVEGVDVDDNWLPNYFNTNLKIGWAGEFYGTHNTEIALFVTNLFDKDPMIIPSYNSRTGSQIVSNNYDAYGRSYDPGYQFRLVSRFG